MGLDQYFVLVSEHDVPKLEITKSAFTSKNIEDVHLSSKKRKRSETDDHVRESACGLFTHMEKMQDVEDGVGYWRGWRQLNNWMEKLFELKGGYFNNENDPDGFNCAYTRLTLQDLEMLESAEEQILKTRVPLNIFSSGFENEQEHNRGSIAKAVAEARKWIAKGYLVFYHCGW